MQLRRYPEACEEFAKAVELSPRPADVQRNLGTCFFQKND